VIRLSAENQLVDSKPCCMCSYLMRIYGIKKVYYSTEQGEICCQNLTQLSQEPPHFSHGLRLMIQHDFNLIQNKKLPLTKSHKNFLIHHL
jgi:tRNA(Arg) A34 adenosine deaminase TadA